MTDRQKQIDASLLVIRVVADAIRELGSVPSGHLYARIMNTLSLEQYNSVIGVLKRAGLVEERSHLLKWVHFEQDTKGRDLELRYFRDSDGREVDFVVVEGRRPLLFVEAKWISTRCRS